ncbi:DoxX family membrane protein [Salsuginibacillus kocurii]|uniref:DoxX family membrane protein n=1 Tax=Salsuginibacillus kocurii TaxID=427078 RepID=UPI000380201C|nr:DoxX family membrane protein [Salsuginibacillus kocurii]
MLKGSIDIVFVILRVLLGCTLLLLGGEKLFDVGAIRESFAETGIPGHLSYFLAVIETMLGFILVLGYFTRVTAVLAGIMLLLSLTWFPITENAFVITEGLLIIMMFTALLVLIKKEHRFSAPVPKL